MVTHTHPGARLLSHTHPLMLAHRHTHLMTPAHHRSYILMSAHLHTHIVTLAAVMHTSLRLFIVNLLFSQQNEHKTWSEVSRGAQSYGGMAAHRNFSGIPPHHIAANLSVMLHPSAVQVAEVASVPAGAGQEDEEDEWLTTGSIYLGRQVLRSVLDENGHAKGFVEGRITKWLPVEVMKSSSHLACIFVKCSRSHTGTCINAFHSLTLSYAYTNTHNRTQTHSQF